MRTQQAGLAIAPVVATAALVALNLGHAPAAARFPLAMLVFLLAPGFAAIGLPRENIALLWSLILGISIAVDLLLAEILVVSRDLFVLPFLGVLLLIVALTALGREIYRRHRVGDLVPSEA
jgi:hypothetical protein